MNKIQKIVMAAAVISLAVPMAEAGNVTPEKERLARQQLRFRHARPQSEGLYGVPKAEKPSKVPVIKSTTGRPELIANCTSSKVGYGMYSFYAEPSLMLNRIAETPAFFGGAVYVNGKYYAADYDYDYLPDGSTTLSYVQWYVYDAVTWRREKVVDNPLDYTYIATDRTYDATTGRVYSVTYDKTASAINLSITSLEDGSSTPVGALEKDVIMIAAAPNGQLYGLDTSANLYKVDKNTAALTLVGNTRIAEDYLSEYTQSITFDPDSGKILWAEFHSAGMFNSSSALYQVDPATASTVKIADLPGAPEMIGMYVTDYLPAGVPVAVSNLSVTPVSAGSLQCNISFYAPMVSTDGKDLNGKLNIEISVDGDLLDIKETQPGSKVNCGPFTLTRGLHTVKVITSNNAGDGAVAARVFFAGYDVPGAPNNVRLMLDKDGKVLLRWDAPEDGAEGGLFRDPVKYNVVRMPDNVKVADAISETSFSETLTEAARYYYIVTPISADGEGTPAESNGVVAGSCSLPFLTSFDTQADFDMWTVVDVASQGKVWNYDEDNNRLRHPWGLGHAIDDYIVSPGFRMNGANTYLVSFDAYQMVEGYDEHVMLYFGQSTDVSKMTLVTDTKKLSETPTNYQGTVAPTSDGIWYIAFRVQAPANGFMSYVDNVRVMEKGSSNVAMPVNNLVATAADGGKLEVTVSFDAPTSTMGGASLSSISHIDIFRGESNEAIKSFDNPVPGSHIDWTDTSVKTGTYTYRVVAYTQAGAGEPVLARVYAGVDVPQAPRNFKASGSEGARQLTWDAPVEGEKGGNLKGVVSYKLVRMVNDDAQTISDDLTATEYTDTWTTQEQAFVYYALTAVTTAGKSAEVTTPSFAVGDPYTLPFKESFADGKAQNKPWSVEQVTGAQGSWVLEEKGQDPYTSAQDGDNGMATFDGYHSWTEGVELRLISPTIDLRSYKNIKLTFYIYQYNGQEWYSDPEPVGETMKVEISENGGSFKAIPGADYKLYDTKSGWKKYELSLDNYSHSRAARIAFRGKGAGNFNIHLDNIEIDGTYDPSAVEEIASKETFARGGKGEILFFGLTDEAEVFDMSGRRVAVVSAGSSNLAAESGIYAVVYNGKVSKVIVK